MLRFETVTKRYGSLTALDRVSFEIPDGQVVGLLGENGAGKTTALNIMTGCLAPTAGSICVCGHDLLSEPREAKRCIGYLPENAPLYDEMTIDGFLRFMAGLKEVAANEIAAHLEEICEITGIKKIRNRKTGNLSKGLRQRVALAAALCGSPEVIILDEPTSGLDPAQILEFRQLIHQISGEHTVIFSSHILSEVQAVSERVLILHQGKLSADHNISALPASVRNLDIIIADTPEIVLPLVKKLQCVRDVRFLPDQIPGQTHIILTVAADQKIMPERELFNALSTINAPIMQLIPVTDSLEDIFLRVTGTVQ